MLFYFLFKALGILLVSVPPPKLVVCMHTYHPLKLRLKPKILLYQRNQMLQILINLLSSTQVPEIHQHLPITRTCTVSFHESFIPIITIMVQTKVTDFYTSLWIVSSLSPSQVASRNFWPRGVLPMEILVSMAPAAFPLIQRVKQKARYSTLSNPQDDMFLPAKRQQS